MRNSIIAIAIITVSILAVIAVRKVASDAPGTTSESLGSATSRGETVEAAAGTAAVASASTSSTAEGAERLGRALSSLPNSTDSQRSRDRPPIDKIMVPDLGSGNPLEDLAPEESELFAQNSIEIMRLSAQLENRLTNGEITQEEALAALDARSKDAEKKLRALMGEKRFDKFEERMLRYGQEMAQVAETEGDESLQEEIGSTVIQNPELTDRILDALDK